MEFRIFMWLGTCGQYTFHVDLMLSLLNVFRNINGFFLDIFSAIGAAEGSASAGVSQIVTLLDPIVHPSEVLQDILMALSFGLSLFAEGSNLVKALIRSMPQSTTLTGKLFPAGTIEGEFQDWSLVEQNLGQVTDAYRKSVAETLPIIQNNVDDFTQFSRNSGLSGFRPSLNGLADKITLSFNTYVISRIMATQGFIVSRSADTDVHALQTNGSHLRWDTGCSGGYTNGICDSFFWDGKDTYGLTDTSHWTKDLHKELMTLMGGDKPLTTGELLFKGAQDCFTATGKNGGATPGLNPGDLTSFTCLSNLKVCTWAQDGLGPFDTTCQQANDGKKSKTQTNDVLPQFGIAQCGLVSRFSKGDGIAVPRVYLGPGVYKDNRKIKSLKKMKFCDTDDL